MFTQKQITAIMRAFPLKNLERIAIARTGQKPLIRGLQAHEILDGRAVMLLHPQVKPWEWRALVGLKHV